MAAMLKAGVPLSKVDLFRDLLKEHGYALTSSTNLRQLIPFIHRIGRIEQGKAGDYQSAIVHYF